MERLIVADWYRLDPCIVDRWPMPKYTDRQEYMFVKNELESKPPPTGRDGIQPVGAGEVEYRGPSKHE